MLCYAALGAACHEVLTSHKIWLRTQFCVRTQFCNVAHEHERSKNCERLRVKGITALKAPTALKALRRDDAPPASEYVWCVKTT
jgi:hypothetical protein